MPMGLLEVARGLKKRTKRYNKIMSAQPKGCRCKKVHHISKSPPIKKEERLLSSPTDHGSPVVCRQWPGQPCSSAGRSSGRRTDEQHTCTGRTWRVQPQRLARDGASPYTR